MYKQFEKIYNSSLDKNFLVIFINNDNIFNENEIAITDIQKLVIFINNRFAEFWDEKEFLAIEAHEISHFIAGHTEYKNIELEKQADKLAYLFLRIKNKKSSSQIIKDRFFNKYNFSITKYHLPKKVLIKFIIYLIKNFLIIRTN